MFLARLPMTMNGVLMTLYIVAGLGRGYGAAGLVGGGVTLGMALGAPMLGRCFDRYGLRPVVAVCGIGTTVFWIAAPHLPFETLAVVAVPAGMLSVPAGSLARQALATLVPPEQRRAAYSLDTISIEATFMVGPAAGIAAITAFSPMWTLTALGVLFGGTAFLIWLVDPPIREGAGQAAELGPRPPLRSWLTGRLVGTLLIAGGALFVLIGTELATLAALRANGELGVTGLVIVVMCTASITGGIVHGLVKRSLPQGVLMLLLALLVMPVGLADHPWWLLMLALIPTNLMCAPTLSATTETVTRLAPPRVRGEAMGLQDAFTRLGLAVGGPVVGFAIDHSSPEWGFVAAGLGGLAIASAGLLRRRGPATAAEPALAAATAGPE
ncbi:major facilitator transporter [Amycolatopsis mediterranei S699]|uniref:Major facilitator transporter n=3 Tax=Amycolatopsis mediterranei TaxID=33910 RepID=A0A0H3DK55_AMYMU|nr:MFS transporter [Amycolatopsis mediterranei]ADJ50568.1 major facilitator transporter [Amycolatopsis mediterranei U32]AEK47574.1 major facilitator transporter [Amycolatopsis mediterranei S699]AFO82274.1 major facilitator transporter [Amycolatopsis mediterranei S699]AGT89403.1 major facilitator transporter [Amycolatopsis mediterranei RB]KDO09248.1 MFS transporter [Amycolatopsis mediterranei]